MKDYYSILGVLKTASKKDIQKAYRKLSKTMHPDVGGDVEGFRDVTEAYEVLSNDRKRKMYDEGCDPCGLRDPKELAVSKLGGIFNDVIDALVEGHLRGADLQSSVLKIIRDGLIAELDHNKSEIKKFKKVVKYLEDNIKKIYTRESETNIFQEICKSKKKEGEEHLVQLELNSEVIDECTKILDRYEEREKDKEFLSFLTTGFDGTVSSTNWSSI